MFPGETLNQKCWSQNQTPRLAGVARTGRPDSDQRCFQCFHVSMFPCFHVPMPSPSGSSGSPKALPRRSSTHSVSIPTLSTVKVPELNSSDTRSLHPKTPRENTGNQTCPSPCLPPLPSLSSLPALHMQCNAVQLQLQLQLQLQPHLSQPRSDIADPGSFPVRLPEQRRSLPLRKPGQGATPARARSPASFTAQHGISCTLRLHYHRQLCAVIE